ncbi:MAG: hypothetical protein KME31_10970 [Tolypothrix carrinoi HA7290-LM1]|jgi:hypothetical protein|nr:hypothetical protein [Tolypothrix carrinoi HA7290-LM1]
MSNTFTEQLLNGYSELEQGQLELRGQAGRNPANRFATYLKRQGFLPTVHFPQRFLKRVLSAGVRFDPRTFKSEFYKAKHYRQTRSGYNTRIAVVRGVPIIYRPGGEDGNRIVLVTTLEQGDKLPPVEPASPPRQREMETNLEAELEQLLEKIDAAIESDDSEQVSYDRYIENEYLQRKSQNKSEEEAEAFVVENRLLKIPPGHETLNSQAAHGLPISKTELDAMNRGVRRVDTEKLSNHFKPTQQRRHALRRYKCQKLEEALAETRQQLMALHGKVLSATKRSNAFEWIGEALHLIQDSYSPAHTARERSGAGAIIFIRYYGIKGLPYPQEHRVFPIRQPGRLIPLPVDPRDYVNVSNPPEKAAIAASRDFLKMMLLHLKGRSHRYTAAQWNTKQRSDLIKFMNKYLILSPRHTPTKTLYPKCP